MRILRLPRIAAGLLLLALLAAPGCPRRETPVESGNRQGILHAGNGSEPQDLDPQTVTGVTEHKIIMALLEGLVTEDPQTLAPRPGLAERWEISADGLRYTFHLREGLKWSDGTPLTAPQVVRSYQRMLTPALASEYSYMLHYVVGARDYNAGRITDFSQVGFRAPDDRTVELELEHPVPFLLEAMASHYAWWPVPVHVIERFGGLDRKGTAWTRAGNFVGSGAFQLTEWRPNQRLVVTRNPHYWRADAVRLNAIKFYPIESIDTDERMFRTGQLHYTYEIPNAKIDAYRRDRPEILRNDPYLGLYFYRFNTTRPPFNDPRVRRALALAVDRESLVTNVTRGGQQPAYGPVPPGIRDYVSPRRLTGDADEARALLAAAGFPGGQGFPRAELLYNTSENHRTIAEAIQQMWKRELGIDVTLVNQEWKVYLDSQDTLSYTICRAGWIADYVDPHVFLDLWRTGGGNNDTGWSSARYDELLDRSLRAGSEAERHAIYHEMEAILLEDLPILPIYFYTRNRLVHPSVRGLHPNLLDNHPYWAVSLEP